MMGIVVRGGWLLCGSDNLQPDSPWSLPALSQADQDTLFAMAASCPMYWGDFIYKARAFFWNNDTTQAFLVKSGNSLTITCRVSLPDEASIIVEPGAKLVLDGGTLTSSCDMWRGIRVIGIANQPQGDPETTSPQGIVRMINDAVIENAHEAIHMGPYNTPDMLEKTGGIIIAENSTFRNNWRSVCFNPYNGVPVSKFTNCHFISDSYLKAPEFLENQLHPYGSKYFVTMWGVKNVEFVDNTFENTIQIEYPEESGNFVTLPGSVRGAGITCFDAKPRLTATNITEGKQNKFIGLTYGIHSRQTGSSNRHFIYSSGSLFENTQIGIYSEQSPLDRIEYNTFNIPGAGAIQNTEWPNAQGIYQHNYRYFKAAHNTFNLLSGSPGNYAWGMVSRGINGNAGTSIVTRNDFSGLRYGFQAEASNTRIQLGCNTYSGNTRDWNINPISPGIFADQGTGCGDDEFRPGNKFYDQSPEKKHIWSVNSNQWYYYCRSTVQDEVPVFGNDPATGVERICVNPSLPAPCPSGVGARYDTDLHSLRRTRKAAMDTLRVQREQLLDTLDAGDTPGLLALISNSGTNNTLLSAALASASPLSDTVLSALLLRDSVLNDAQLLSVMSRNLPASELVFNGIQELLTEHPYDKSTHDSLRMLQQHNPYFTTASSLQREYLYQERRWFEAIFGAEAAFMEDEDYPGIISFYKDTLGAGFERELLAAYFGADSLTFARSLLDTFPVQNTDDSLFVAYHLFLLDLKEDSVFWKQLDSTQIVQVRSFAATESSIQDYALSVLELIGDTTLVKFPEESESTPARFAYKEREAQPEKGEDSSLSEAFSIFPNPNSGVFTLKVGSITTIMRVKVTDLTGRNVFDKSYENLKTGEMNLDLSHLGWGVYVCSVFEGNTLAGSQPIVLIR